MFCGYGPVDYGACGCTSISTADVYWNFFNRAAFGPRVPAPFGDRKSFVRSFSQYPSGVTDPYWDSYDQESWEIRADDESEMQIWIADRLWSSAQVGLERVWGFREQRTDTGSEPPTIADNSIVALYDVDNQVEILRTTVAEMGDFIDVPIGSVVRATRRVGGGKTDLWSFYAGVGAERIWLVGTQIDNYFETYPTSTTNGSRFIEYKSDSTYNDSGDVYRVKKYYELIFTPGAGSQTVTITAEMWPAPMVVACRGDGLCFGSHWKLEWAQESIASPPSFNDTGVITERIVLSRPSLATPASYIYDDFGSAEEEIIEDPAIVLADEGSIVVFEQEYEFNVAYESTFVSEWPVPSAQVMSGDATGGGNFICTMSHVTHELYVNGSNELHCNSVWYRSLNVNGELVLSYPIHTSSGSVPAINEFDYAADLDRFWASIHAAFNSDYCAAAIVDYVPDSWFDGEGGIKLVEEWEKLDDEKPWVLAIFDATGEKWRSPRLTHAPLVHHSSDRWIYFQTVAPYDMIEPEVMTADNDEAFGPWTAGPKMSGLAFEGKWYRWRVGIAEDNFGQVEPCGQLTSTPFEIEPFPGQTDDTGTELFEKPYPFSLSENPFDYDVVQNTSIFGGMS